MVSSSSSSLLRNYAMRNVEIWGSLRDNYNEEILMDANREERAQC